MPATPKLALPYPVPSDPADVPADLLDLAQRIDDVTGVAGGLAQLDSLGRPVSTPELGYAQITATVAIPVGTDAAPTDVVSLPALTFDGGVYYLEVVLPSVVTGATLASELIVSLWEGATDLGRIARLKTPAAAIMVAPVHERRRLTPTAGVHTYRARAFALTAAGSIEAGAGGVGLLSPAFIRAVRA